MGEKERIYRVTPAGREAWESQDVAVPADYRRMLWMMDFHGHAGVIGDLVRRFPKHMLDDWLAEMEELGLIEETQEREPEDTHPAFSARDADQTVSMDRAQLQQVSEAAGNALARTGAFVAADRAGPRPGVGKAPSETVVLIVEDDPDQLALADLRVSMAGYKVRVARSVNAYLQSMLDEGAPDLLLLDVVLPDGNGFDVLAKIRRHPVLSSLPVVLLTAKDDAADIGKGLLLGADGYITKPYTKNILADVIRRVLKHDRAA
jgi:two-component system OmpR family response regulator